MSHRRTCPAKHPSPHNPHGHRIHFRRRYHRGSLNDAKPAPLIRPDLPSAVPPPPASFLGGGPQKRGWFPGARQWAVVGGRRPAGLIQPAPCSTAPRESAGRAQLPFQLQTVAVGENVGGPLVSRVGLLAGGDGLLASRVPCWADEVDECLIR